MHQKQNFTKAIRANKVPLRLWNAAQNFARFCFYCISFLEHTKRASREVTCKACRTALHSATMRSRLSSLVHDESAINAAPLNSNKNYYVKRDRGPVVQTFQFCAAITIRRRCCNTRPQEDSSLPDDTFQPFLQRWTVLNFIEIERIHVHAFQEFVQGISQLASAFFWTRFRSSSGLPYYRQFIFSRQLTVGVFFGLKL